MDKNLDLNEIAVFIKVVQSGSFTAAAKHLAMPISTVSSKLARLEKRLGVTLITRTTRKLTVTAAGTAYFKTCVQGLDFIQSGESGLAAGQGEPQGLLRVTAPVELGSGILSALIAHFIQRHPKVTIETLLTDRRVDLLAEGVDLAIRAGELKDSTLIAKKLGTSSFGVYASKKFVKSRGTPSHPRDLAHHDCLHFTPLGKEQWKLVSARSIANINVTGRAIINDLNLLKSLTLAGAGYSLLPSFFGHTEIKNGELVRVLPEWTTNPSPIHFVYPTQKFIAPKLRAFIEMTTEPLKKSLLAPEK